MSDFFLFYPQSGPLKIVMWRCLTQDGLVKIIEIQVWERPHIIPAS